MLSEISQRKTNTLCYHLHVESKKIKQTNICYKTETDSKIREQSSGYQWGEGRRGEVGVGGEQIQTTMYKINKQPGYIV